MCIRDSYNRAEDLFNDIRNLLDTDQAAYLLGLINELKTYPRVEPYVLKANQWQETADGLTYTITDNRYTYLGSVSYTHLVLEKTLSTAKVSENVERGTKEIKLGGVSHYKEQRYIFLFVNEDKDVRIMLLGSNEAGLTLQFMKDKETVINQKIVGEPFPDGHKAIVELGVPKVVA